MLAKGTVSVEYYLNDFNQEEVFIQIFNVTDDWECESTINDFYLSIVQFTKDNKKKTKYLKFNLEFEMEYQYRTSIENIKLLEVIKEENLKLLMVS